MEKIKIAVVGAGSIAQMGHLPFYSNHPDVELTALVDINTDRAKGVADQFGVKQVYRTLDDMFADEKVDAVSICTTNHTHVPLAKIALQNGAHVLIEKPLASTLADALELEEFAKKSNKMCMIGMTHRFRNDSKAMKKMIDAGSLGDIYYGKARILQRRNTPTGWFTDKSKSGGGPLMDIGVHVLDLAWWLAGQPEALSTSGHLVKGIGQYKTLMQERWESADKDSSKNQLFDVEDFASAFIRFKNGFILQLEVSWAINGPKDDGIKIELFGTKGGMTLSPLCFYSEQNQLLTESQIDVIPNNPYEAEIHHFVQVVKNHEQPLIDIAQGVSVMKMLSAISASSHQQKELVLDQLLGAAQY